MKYAIQDELMNEEPISVLQVRRVTMENDRNKLKEKNNNSRSLASC